MRCIYAIQGINKGFSVTQEIIPQYQPRLFRYLLDLHAVYEFPPAGRFPRVREFTVWPLQYRYNVYTPEGEVRFHQLLVEQRRNF